MSEAMERAVEAGWSKTLDRCAATKGAARSEVSRVVMFSRDDLEAAIRAAFPILAEGWERDAWLDIDSAPRDGTAILAYFPLDGLDEHWCRVVPVYWQGGGRWTFASRAASGFSREYQPTHWRPIVAPLRTRISEIAGGRDG